MESSKALRERAGEYDGMLQDLANTVKAEERDMTEAEIADFDKWEEERDNLLARAESAERLEKVQPAKPQTRDRISVLPKQYTREDAHKALRAWLCRNKDSWKDEYGHAADRLGFNFRNDVLNLTLSDNWNTRSLSVGTNDNGGYSVNDTVISGFEKALKRYWNWSDLVTVRRTQDGSSYAILTNNDTSNKAAYTDELAAVVNVDLSFARTVFDAYKLTSGVFPVSNELLEDSSVDIAGIIGESLGERMGRKLADEVTNGDGSGNNHITGFTSGSVNAGNSVYVDALVYEDYLKLFFALEPAYRSNAVWMLPSSWLEQLMLLVDTTGRPLFQGMTGGMNEAPRMTLFGRPIVINDSISATAEAGEVPVYFGDFSHYHVRIARDIQIKTSSELYFKEDAVATIATMRVDGKLVNAGTNPIKHITLNSSSGAPSIDDDE